MNLDQKFSILFWLKKDKINKQGLAPLWVRITIDGKRAEFSTQRQIPPGYWDSTKGRVFNHSPVAKSINDYIVLLKADLTRRYNILLTTKEVVTADDVRDSYKGLTSDQKTFFQLFEQFNNQLTERKEIEDLSEGRHKRFGILEGKLRAFIKAKFKRNDIPLPEIKLAFAVELSHYLRTVQKIGHNTAMKYIKDLKQVMRFAVMMEYIPSNPLEYFKCSYKRVQREYLDQNELDNLYKKKFSIKRLEEVRDCYVFSCYTGYGYSDAEALSPDDITVGIDSHNWIVCNRIKTNTPENVLVLPIAQEIINKYRNHPYCKANNRLLPMNSNQRYNAYIKEVADLCGIKKNLTSHTARHTFATTVLLLNDVPMETVMELLGHTDIRTTQIYGKIVQKKISADMVKLKQRLKEADKRVHKTAM